MFLNLKDPPYIRNNFQLNNSNLSTGGRKSTGDLDKISAEQDKINSQTDPNNLKSKKPSRKRNETIVNISGKQRAGYVRMKCGPQEYCETRQESNDDTVPHNYPASFETNTAVKCTHEYVNTRLPFSYDDQQTSSAEEYQETTFVENNCDSKETTVDVNINKDGNETTDTIEASSNQENINNEYLLLSESETSTAKKEFSDQSKVTKDKAGKHNRESKQCEDDKGITKEQFGTAMEPLLPKCKHRNTRHEKNKELKTAAKPIISIRLKESPSSIKQIQDMNACSLPKVEEVESDSNKEILTGDKADDPVTSESSTGNQLLTQVLTII